MIYRHLGLIELNNKNPEQAIQYLLKAWPTIIELSSVYKRLREF